MPFFLVRRAFVYVGHRSDSHTIFDGFERYPVFQLFTKVMNLSRRFGVDKSHIPRSPPLALLGCPGAESPL